jgi:hypothetical protein
MFQFDPATGVLSLPLWITATVAAILIVLAVLAMVRGGAVKTIVALAVIGVAGYGGWMATTLVQRLEAKDRIEEHRAFEQRANDLLARAMMPNSSLSCLDGLAGEQVEAGCEKLLFATPESIAAAVSYVATRLSLIADGLDYAARSELNYEPALTALRTGLQADRYGLVAYVMSLQESCQPSQCETLGLLKDPNRVRANLQDKPFEALVARYAPSWPATRAPSAAVETRQPGGGPSGVPVSSKYDFPSSASIPPVSIMSSEPAAPPAAPSTTASTPAPAATTAPSASAAPAPNGQPLPVRRPPAARAPVARAPAPDNAPPPVQLTPTPPQGASGQR